MAPGSTKILPAQEKQSFHRAIYAKKGDIGAAFSNHSQCRKSSPENFRVGGFPFSMKRLRTPEKLQVSHQWFKGNSFFPALLKRKIADFSNFPGSNTLNGVQTPSWSPFFLALDVVIAVYLPAFKCTINLN